MKTLKKAPIAVAVATAMTASGVSANESMTLISSGMSGLLGDGYMYSGQTARSQSLQMNYFTHDDQGNIWVNPALAGEYDDRVMINVNNNNNNGQGSGGIMYGTGTQAFGFYIGRDTVSNFGPSLNLDNNDLITLDPDTPTVEGRQNPESQFDLFYAIGLGGINLGARLNYQNNEQEADTGPDQVADIVNAEDGTGTPVGFPDQFATIDEMLEHRIRNIEASFANDDTRPDDEELVFEGDASEDREQSSADFEAEEINLSLGFDLPALGLDGAVLIGQASGTRTRTESSLEQEYTLFIDDNDQQARRQTSEEEETTRDQLDIDDGTTFGLALRYTIWDNADSTLRLSGSFVSQDYTGEQTSTMRSDETFWDDDEDNERQGTIESRLSRSGELVRENDQFTFLATYEMRPVEDTEISLSSGFVMSEMDRGFSGEIVENITTDRADQDNFQGLDEGQFRETFGTVGMQAREDEERELLEIPLILAVEHNVNDRWTARGSISRNLFRDLETTTTEFEFAGTETPDAIDPPDADDENQSTQSGPARTVETNRERMGTGTTWIQQPTQVRLGAGYQRGNFGIDTLIGKEFFTQGTDNTLFAAASFTYDF